MSLPQLHTYAKICNKYAKYVKFICIKCTSHWHWHFLIDETIPHDQQCKRVTMVTATRPVARCGSCYAMA